MAEILPLKQIKDMIRAREQVSGLTFVNERGARGTVLEELSDHKKRQAEMTCTSDNCLETHIREQSDWHQSFLCRTHSKSRGKSENVALVGIRTEDGGTFRYQRILDSDDAEVRILKEANNQVYASLRTQQVEAAKAARMRSRDERDARQKAEQAARAARVADDQKRALIARLSTIKEYSEKHNLPIHPSVFEQIKKFDGT